MSGFVTLRDAGAAYRDEVEARRRRLVAGRGVLLRNGLSDGAATQATYRQRITVGAEDALDVGLVYANWRNPSGAGEAAGPNAITVRAAIEYPAGTMTPVFFGGRREVVMEPGAQATSDAGAGVSIPAGAQAWVRTHVSAASGGKWPLGVTTVPGDGEGSNLSGGGADLTTSGTVPTAFAYGYGPLAVTGLTAGAQRAVVVLGDSIASGQADNPANDMGFVVRAIGGRCGWSSLAMPAEQAAQIVTGGGRRMALAGRFATTAVCNHGINDLVIGRTAQQVQASLLALWKGLAARGLEVFHTTLTPRTTSSDGWATLGGQSAYANEAERQAINAWLRSGPSPHLTGVFDVAAVLEDGTTGRWKAPAEGALTGDGLHPKPAGYALMAATVSL